MSREYSHRLRDWVNANPMVKEWYDKLAVGSKNTAQVYGSCLWKYWTESLSKTYPSIDKWVDEVKEQHFDRDLKVQQKWGDNLQKFVLTTGMMEGSRFVLVQAIKSFLGTQTNLSKYKFKLVEKEQRIAEAKARQDEKPLSLEEIRTLVNAASTRDRTIILCQVSAGLGVGELIQFSKDWKKYVNAIRDKKAPLRINLVRPKTLVEYHTYLWDDAVQALHDLLMERAHEWGPNPDYLFVNQYKKPIVEDDIQAAVRNLADRTGLEPNRGPDTPRLGRKPVYRIRPHNFRDYFKTSCENSEVPDTISEFCMGHEIDELGYNQFQKTDEGKERIVKALGKVRPKLNILTQRGEALLKDHEAQIRQKAMRDLYHTQINAGILKPEAFDVKTLEIICKAVGIEVSQLIQLADTDMDRRMALFDVLAGVIDLDRETYHRYMEALRVMKPTSAKAAWENTDNYWMRVEVGTDEYMQALADHFVVEDKEGTMRILRKSKTQPAIEEGTSRPLSGQN